MQKHERRKLQKQIQLNREIEIAARMKEDGHSNTEIMAALNLGDFAVSQRLMMARSMGRLPSIGYATTESAIRRRMARNKISMEGCSALMKRMDPAMLRWLEVETGPGGSLTDTILKLLAEAVESRDKVAAVERLERQHVQGTGGR